DNRPKEVCLVAAGSVRSGVGCTGGFGAKSVPLQAEQYDWLADTNEEVDEQVLEVHYNYMAKIQEVPTADSGTDSEPVEQTKQAEFEKFKAFNDRTIDYDKLERKLNDALGQLAHNDTVIRE
nr:hypothetical protein [Tanacetum cinerariifolium]